VADEHDGDSWFEKPASADADLVGDHPTLGDPGIHNDRDAPGGLDRRGNPDSDEADAGAGDSVGSRVDALDEMESVLVDVEHALARLREGTYGRCEACGEEIPEAVLAESPAARWCDAHRTEAGVGPGASALLT